jgi:hypothetical protein
METGTAEKIESNGHYSKKQLGVMGAFKQEPGVL